MMFSGAIDNVSASASGDFEVDFDGTICSGTWQAAAGQGTVTGALRLPAEAQGKQYVVLIDNDFDGDNGVLTGTYGICNAGTTVNYTIATVPAGVYCIYAVVYMGNDDFGAPQDGDYLGFYGGIYGTDTFPSEANALVPSLGTATVDISLGIWSEAADGGGGGGDGDGDDGDDGGGGGGGGGGGCFVKSADHAGQRAPRPACRGAYRRVFGSATARGSGGVNLSSNTRRLESALKPQR
jgi:hypothetical protein